MEDTKKRKKVCTKHVPANAVILVHLALSVIAGCKEYVDGYMFFLKLLELWFKKVPIA